jgi:glycerol-3-phosphate dehydrogenase
VLNAIDAREHGASIHVHTTVERVEPLGAEPTSSLAPRATMGTTPGTAHASHAPRWRVHARDRLTGVAHVVDASVVVNATGAWAPLTAALGGLAPHRARVRPGKGIHVVFDRRLCNYAIVARAIDGRQIFLEPWQNMTILGTTDDDYYGDLDDCVATSEEVRYLVEGLARVFPSIGSARAVGTYAGVRPTLYAFGSTEDRLSREHAVVDHRADGAPGFFSVIGGKLASYRLLAQELSDRVALSFGLAARCSTHERPLPGGERVPDALALAEENALGPVLARRLVYRHGGRAERIVARMKRDRRERAVVCPCEPVTEAEVRHAIAEEGARTVADVARRTRLGLGACGGMRCAVPCGQIVADALELSPAEGLLQARAFLERAARARIPAMGPEQARQESLALAHLQAQIGVHADARPASAGGAEGT